MSESTGVTWRPIRCPMCHSQQKTTDSVRETVRYHNCKVCGYRYKSVEDPPPPPPKKNSGLSRSAG